MQVARYRQIHWFGRKPRRDYLAGLRPIRNKRCFVGGILIEEKLQANGRGAGLYDYTCGVNTGFRSQQSVRNR